MRKIFYILLFCSAFCGATTGFAFDAKDKATVTLTLGPAWKLTPNFLADPTKTSQYEKVTDIPSPAAGQKSILIKLNDKKSPPPATQTIQSITQRVDPKPAHVATEDFINQMAQILTKGLSSKGCETGAPLNEPQVGDNFRVWVQVFQCEKSSLTGLQFYIDADPQNIYLITYTDTEYPFTLASRAAIEKEIKSALKICYQTGQCFPVQ
jgi:hypothetical protein